MASTVCLGIWSEDLARVENVLKTLSPDTMKKAETPDEIYFTFFWDWRDWETDDPDVNELLGILKGIRHSYIECTDYGRIIEDIVPFDSRGIDEEFHDLISWTPRFFTFDEEVLLKDQMTAPEQEKPDYHKVLSDMLDDLGDSIGDILSEVLGVDVSEPLEEAVETMKETSHPDWKITPKELRRVLNHHAMDFSMKDGKFHLEDANWPLSRPFDDQDTPQDFLDMIEAFFRDYYLDGYFTETPVDFDSYHDAEVYAREHGLSDDAEILHIIVKALGNDCPETDAKKSKWSKTMPVFIDGTGSDINPNGYYENGQVFVDGVNVLEGRETPYRDMLVITDEFTYVGIHSCNPGCYSYLDKVLVVRNSDLSYKKVPLWKLFGTLNPITELSANINGLVTVSNGKKSAIVHPLRIFDDTELRGTTIPYHPELKNKDFADFFEYRILGDYGVIMTLKEDKMKLLDYPGFNLMWDTFKFWNLGCGTSYLLFLNSEKGTSWEVSWGNSTTITDGSVWQRRDLLLDAMKKKIPTHPAWKEECYLTEV